MASIYYKYKIFCILVISFTYLISAFTFTEEGCKCRVNITGTEGMCKSINDCPEARDLLQKNIHPQTCGFSGKIPLVCCAIRSETETSVPHPCHENSTIWTSSLKLQNQENVPDEDIGKLSRKKCKDYHPFPRYPIFVTGGKPSLAKEFPHMAIIGYGKEENIQWQCAGSLITKNMVLTAAHCLISKIGKAQYVRVGDLDLSTDKDDASPADFKIIRAIPHPLFKPPVRYHDIALLQLDREIIRSAYVTPACLYTERQLLKDLTMTATGWGRTEFGGNSSSIMMKVLLNHVPNEKCVKNFGQISATFVPDGIVDDFMICAGGTIGEDTCQGDSGGALQIPDSKKSFLVKVHSIIGITSFGKACGLSKAPGIYTRVYNYIPWIESIAWENDTGSEDVLEGWRPLN